MAMDTAEEMQSGEKLAIGKPMNYTIFILKIRTNLKCNVISICKPNDLFDSFLPNFGSGAASYQGHDRVGSQSGGFFERRLLVQVERWSSHQRSKGLRGYQKAASCSPPPPLQAFVK